MDIVHKKYIALCNYPNDINEHLPTLYSYATECESILETGVRGCVSSWAFINGLLNNNSSNKKITAITKMSNIDTANFSSLTNYNINSNNSTVTISKTKLRISDFTVNYSATRSLTYSSSNNCRQPDETNPFVFSKQYDGNLDYNYDLSSVQFSNGDDVTLGDKISINFIDSNGDVSNCNIQASYKIYNKNSDTISDNYESILVFPSNVVAKITPSPVSITATKEYDGNTIFISNVGSVPLYYTKYNGISWSQWSSFGSTNVNCYSFSVTDDGSRGIVTDSSFVYYFTLFFSIR